MSSLISKYGCKLAQITPLYSDLDVSYNQAQSGRYEDLSHIDEDVCVIAGLKDGRISGFWRPMVALGKSKVVKAQMERLYNISNDIYLIDYLEGGIVSVATRFLLQKDLVARPFYTQIIDLTKTEEELHADLRKSYKSLINKDLEHISAGHIPAFVDIVHHTHRIMHDMKETRSQETWDIQQQMVEAKQMFAVLDASKPAKRCWKVVGGALFWHNEHSCYYGVGCSLGGANSHAVIWKAILHAKELGCKTFEMGEQVFSGDDKLIGISKFKAGFGGQCLMRLLVGK